MNQGLAIGVTGVLSLAVASWATMRGVAAAGDSSSHAHRLAVVQQDAQQLAELRAARPATIGEHEPGTGTHGGLNSEVADSLVRCGIPVGVMAALAPDADSAITGGLRRRTFRLTLQPLRLPELGQFLQDWRTHAPAWRAISMQCTPVALDPKQPLDRSKDVPAPLSVLLVFECVYAPPASTATDSRSITLPRAAGSSIPANSSPLLR